MSERVDIEILIDYIQKKGFEVDVRPNALIIRKTIGGQLLSLGWGIAPIELTYADKDTLFFAADQKLQEFTYAENFAKMSDQQ